MSDLPNKTEDKPEALRGPDGRILRGSPPLNPKGRPKGQTLKEFARELLMSLTPAEKRKYLAELPKDIVWKMAEGNPHQSVEEQVEVNVPQPLLEALRGTKPMPESQET